MRLGGSARPIAASEARTRSRLSATALSGSPTTANAGRPWRDLHLHIDVEHVDALKRDGVDAGDHGPQGYARVVSKGLSHSVPDARWRLCQSSSQMSLLSFHQPF